MAKRKKVSRKQLLKQPDEFLTTSAKLLQWAHQRKKQLMYALVAIIAVALGISGYRYHSAQMDKKAFNALAEALAKYAPADGPQGSEARYLAVQKEFDALLEQHASRRGGHFAALYYANICFRSGQTEKALALYLDALNVFEDPFLRNQIRMNIGYAYQAREEHDRAADYFEKVAGDKMSTLAAEALFHLSLSYEALGRTDRSTDALRQIVEHHGDYVYIDMITERLATRGV